jgi:hypothetical protein
MITLCRGKHNRERPLCQGSFFHSAGYKII